MKKTFVALATLAVAGAASAQSSVTMFGVVDAAVSNFSNRTEDLNGPTVLNPTYVNRGTVKTSRTELRHSAYNTSRFGFRGTEDLGGGLAASFWLEAPISNDDGQQGISTFARRSTVSLSGGFGELRLGRDYSPSFWNDSVFDPFGVDRLGDEPDPYRFQWLLCGVRPAITPVPGITNVTGNSSVRNSNSVGYSCLPTSAASTARRCTRSMRTRNTTPAPRLHLASLPGLVNTRGRRHDACGPVCRRTVGYLKGPLDVAIAVRQHHGRRQLLRRKHELPENCEPGCLI